MIVNHQLPDLFVVSETKGTGKRQRHELFVTQNITTDSTASQGYALCFCIQE